MIDLIDISLKCWTSFFLIQCRSILIFMQALQIKLCIHIYFEIWNRIIKRYIKIYYIYRDQQYNPLYLTYVHNDVNYDYLILYNLVFTFCTKLFSYFQISDVNLDLIMVSHYKTLVKYQYDDYQMIIIEVFSISQNKVWVLLKCVKTILLGKYIYLPKVSLHIIFLCNHV